MKKEAILICLYAYFPFENANTNVMLPLIKRLASTYEVHILTENRDNSALKYEISNSGIIIHRYRHLGKLARNLQNLANLDKKKKRNLSKKFFINVLSPIARLLDQSIWFTHPEYILIRKLMTKINFKFVITTCASFYSHRNMLKYKKESLFTTPWIAYFMDPFAYYIGNRTTDGELLKLECQVYEQADLIFVTEEIYKENQNNAFSPYLYKTYPYRFGNFHCVDKPLKNNIFIAGKINCVYVGSLFSEQIRNPKYLYQMINHIDDHFAFHIICNQISEANKRAYKQIVKKTQNVFWYHNLPLEECLGIMCHADVLINLGNKSVNQTPSKVFDYIGTGNPIVNIYPLENDTSKHYLENYPLKLNIFESPELLEENAQKFMVFARENLGKKIPAKQLQEEFADFSSDRVTTETINNINKIL